MKPSLLAELPMPPVTYIFRRTMSSQMISSGRKSVASPVIDGEIRHRTIEVHGADRVADDLGLLAHRLVVLGVLAEERAAVRPSPLIHEVPRQSEPPLLPRVAPELDERQLDLRMAADVVALAGTEDGVDVRGEALGDVEQPGLARRLRVGDGRLDEMAGAVHLVPVSGVLPALLGLHEREVRVEVTVLLLRSGDELDDRVDAFFHRLVARHGERVGRAFDDLVDVGIVEEVALVLPLLLSRRDREVADAAGDLALVEVRVERGGPVRLEARRPEPVVDLHRRERHGLTRVSSRRRCGFPRLRAHPGGRRGDDEGDRERDLSTSGSEAHRALVPASKSRSSHHDPLRHGLPSEDLSDGVEGHRAEERIALDGAVQLARDHRLECALDAVDRHDDHVLAGL